MYQVFTTVKNSLSASLRRQENCKVGFFCLVSRFGVSESIAYSTPHVVCEHLFSVALDVCHQYVLTFQRLTVADKKRHLEQTREIDLCAKLADFFGP